MFVYLCVGQHIELTVEIAREIHHNGNTAQLHSDMHIIACAALQIDLDMNMNTMADILGMYTRQVHYDRSAITGTSLTP